MSRKSSLSVVMAFVAAFAFACGNENPPIDIGNDVGGEDTIVPDEGHDTAVPDTGMDIKEDTGTPDVFVDDGNPVDVQDVNVADVQPDVESDATDIVEEIPVVPFCPCDGTVNEPVCGVDEVTYANAACAACALCADSFDCPGCGGEIACVTTGDTNFLLRRTSCDECPCNLVDECEAQVQPIESCGVVCGADGETEYTDLCDLKEKNHCAPVLDDLIGYFGECLEAVCAACEEYDSTHPADPQVCGSDGETYKNKCWLGSCPVSGTPTKACDQACPCPI